MKEGEFLEHLKNALSGMSNETLAVANFLIWNEAYSRSGQHLQDEVESTIESLISETNKPR